MKPGILSPCQFTRFFLLPGDTSAAKQLCYCICAFDRTCNKPQVHQVNVLANIVAEWNCGFTVGWKDYIAKSLQSWWMYSTHRQVTVYHTCTANGRDLLGWVSLLAKNKTSCLFYKQVKFHLVVFPLFFLTLVGVRTLFPRQMYLYPLPVLSALPFSCNNSFSFRKDFVEDGVSFCYMKQSKVWTMLQAVVSLLLWLS